MMDETPQDMDEAPWEETPQEREQRLAEMKEAMAVDKRLRRARSAELKAQSKEVQGLAHTMDWLEQYAEMFESIGLGGGLELPATAAAREGLVKAMRVYAAELGVELRSRWVAP